MDKEYDRIIKNGGISILPPEVEIMGQKTSYIAYFECNLIETSSRNKLYEIKGMNQ